MLLQTIMNEIMQNHILTESVREWRELKGGTESMVGVIGTPAIPKMYTVKANSPERIAEESRFYELYREITLLPQIKYIDPGYRYFIYKYIPGATCYRRGTKQVLLSELVQRMMHHYVRPESVDDNYEWVEAPERVEHDIRYAESVISTHLKEEDYCIVKEIHCRRSIRLSKKNVYVLHGDFGVHNFLFEDGKLTGVIDPIPVVGRPLYDLLYAFCSSPDDLTLPLLLNAARQLIGEPVHKLELIDDMVLALFFRIATCIIHHPHDLVAYKNAWNEWKQLLKQG